MEAEFICPHCGKELTQIALELDKIRRQHEGLQEKVQEIMQTVFDGVELGSVSDRFGTIHPHKITGE
jgi:hypothetical protein